MPDGMALPQEEYKYVEGYENGYRLGRMARRHPGWGWGGAGRRNLLAPIPRTRRPGGRARRRQAAGQLRAVQELIVEDVLAAGSVVALHLGRAHFSDRLRFGRPRAADALPGPAE